MAWMISISDEMPGPWRLNLPPLATGEQGISISDEMPGPWRRLAVPQELSAFADFNLRRDARPLATPDALARETLSRQISISDEMPGPWRRTALLLWKKTVAIFQSQTRCQAPGDACSTS